MKLFYFIFIFVIFLQHTFSISTKLFYFNINIINPRTRFYDFLNDNFTTPIKNYNYYKIKKLKNKKIIKISYLIYFQIC